MTDGRADRAAARRAQPWPAEVVRAGTPKPLTDPSQSLEQRLAAYWRLIQRAWTASGRELPKATARKLLPGEVFQITRHG